MGEEARYIARYASVYVRGDTFAEVGDVLAQRGFNMLEATQADNGVLVVPHTNSRRAAAHLFTTLEPVEAVQPEHKEHGPFDAPGLTDPPPTDPDERAAWAQTRLEQMTAEVNGEAPMSLDVASSVLAGAEVESGAVEANFPLTSCECGAVHSEGVVCLIPVWIEKNCCNVVNHGHEGPHEAWFKDPKTGDIIITHRWELELVVTDLPFNGYHPFDPELDGAADE